jgi:hypothetical protein
MPSSDALPCSPSIVSRDACLWYQLQTKVRDLHDNARYDVRYFYTSRLTRYFPSASTLKYIHVMLTDEALVVDLCGSGQSLRRILTCSPLNPSLSLLVGYTSSGCKSFSRVPHSIEWRGRPPSNWRILLGIQWCVILATLHQKISRT